MSEASLFFDLSAHRLRSRARWAGIILALSIVLPYETVDGTAQWIFQILAELPLAAVVAAFAPTLAGVAILAAGVACKRATSLAIAVLVSLATAALTIKIGADAAAWDVLRLPTSFSERPTSALIALAAAGAAANLTFKPHARRIAKHLFVVAGLALAYFYLWPARGEAPLATVARALAQVGDLPNVRYQIGLLMVVGFVLFPLLAVLLALVHLWVPAKGEQSIAGLIGTFGLPALMAFLVYRSMLVATAQSEALGTLGGGALVAAILALVTGALEVVVDALTMPPSEDGPEEQDAERPAGLPVKRVAMIASGAAVAVLVAQSVLARPPSKGVQWSLATATAPAVKEGERVFGELLPKWSAARLAWNHQAQFVEGSGGSAQEMIRVKGTAREMNAAARALDPGVATALETMTREGDELDVAGRRWYRLVADVNEANRKASLPFYLDPTVQLYQTKDGLLRTFRVRSYRIEAVHPVTVKARFGSDAFATLHVRSLGGGFGHSGRLGFSRDMQPFALVVLDEIEVAEKDLRNWIVGDTPSCMNSLDPDAARALATCGKALALLVAGVDLRKEIVTMTERHELQHQIDGPHLPLSGQVLRRMNGYADAPQQTANRELSAYIAELTSAASPKLGLVHLVPFALVARGGAEHHVAVIVLSALSGRKVPSVNRFEGVDAKELGDAVAELFALDDATLRTRASALWKDAFGRALPEVQ